MEEGIYEKQGLMYFATGQVIKMQITEELKMLLVIQTWADISLIRDGIVLIKISLFF